MATEAHRQLREALGMSDYFTAGGSGPAANLTHSPAPLVDPPYYAHFQNWTKDPWGAGWHSWTNSQNYTDLIPNITGQRRRLEFFNNELEQQVRERTQQLTQEMAERRRIDEERRAAEITMLAQSKLAAIGQVATGVAHEINQPLTYIDGMIQTLKEDIELKALNEQHAHQVLAESHKQVERITSIIQHLRIFGRADETECRPFKVKTALDNAMLLIGQGLRLENILLETQIDDDLPSIIGNSNQLEQVFINLFQNAADAFRNQKGSPKITVAMRSSLGQAGVEIEFSDNGIGIAPEHLGTIFDPFFSTKEVGKGTGLGLSIVYGIVRDHGGIITCASKLDEGTTFLITLPGQVEQYA